MTFISCCTYLHGWTQHYVPLLKDTIVPLEKKEMKYKDQRDLIDLTLIVLHKNPDKRLDSTNGLNQRLHLSASPILEYTLSTELTTGIAAGGAFYTNVEKQTNVSSFVGAIKYTQKKQFLLPIQSSVWTAGNKYNLLGDWRYLNFPQDTYGIGGFTTQADQYTITYKYIRFYEFALRHIRNSFYAGAGYQLDHHWGIEELNVPAGHVTDYQIYGFSHSSVSSGVAIDLLYDSRKNSINPEGGSAYANLEFLQNSALLGSSSDWNSVLIDLRRYFTVAPGTSVLAFWFYGVLTISGAALLIWTSPIPALIRTIIPGGDKEQGRFIGKRYVDLEGELRFPITRTGLLGGVIFCNAESVSELSNDRFEVVHPGVGIGLRIKFNKFSNTNACLDYGIGARGSRGFFGNLGEVF